MKVQLNQRTGTDKSGFRILKRFPNMKEAREYLKLFIETNSGFRPTQEPDVFRHEETHTFVWISKQFIPSGDYRYRNPNK